MDDRRLLQELLRRVGALESSARLSPTRAALLSAAGVYLAKVMSNAAGGEKYGAKLFSPRGGKIPAASDLTEEEVGILAATENALFCNLDHMSDNSGHTLTEGGQTPLAIGVFDGYSDESPPRMVIKGFSLNVGC